MVINIIGELLQYIFSLEDPFGRNIVRFIFFVFGLGVINYAVHILRIEYDYFCLKRVQSYIKGNHGLDDISPGLLDKLRAQKFIVQEYLVISSIYKRIRDLVQIKQNHGKIDHDVLGDIHAGAASRKAGLSNYILGTLIILGLIGTLGGLITAISEVQPLLRDIQDLDQLPEILDALRLTLSGMSTAFVTTLAGLVTSLGLGLCGWLFNLSNSAFLTKFETVVSTEILPHFTQAPESALESSMDRLQVSVDEFKLATEDNVRRMEQAIQQLTEKSWDAYLEQQYVITQELGKIPAELRGSLGGINEYQVLIQSTVESSEETAKQFMNKISEFQTAVDTMMNDFKRMTKEAISQVSRDQATLLEGVENVVSELREESAGLEETIRETQRETQSSQARFADELANNLADTLIKGLDTQLQSVLQPITDSQQDMMEGLREVESRISSGLENQNQVFERIRTELITNRQEIGNRLSQLIGELQIRPTLEAQNQVFERIEGHLQGQHELVDEQRQIMQTLDTSVRQLERTFPSAASDEQQRTEEMLKQLSANFETLNEKIGTLNHTMSQPGLYRWGAACLRWIRGDRKWR